MSQPSQRSLKEAREWLSGTTDRPHPECGHGYRAHDRCPECVAALLDRARVEGCKAGLDAAAEALDPMGNWRWWNTHLGQSEGVSPTSAAHACDEAASVIRALSPDEIARQEGK